MSELKRLLRIAPIKNSDAKKLLDRHHPLGSGHAFLFALGIFWAEKCEGVMTFGPPISNLAVVALDLRQCDVLELRKLWVSDVPEKNTESRALAIAARIIRKRYPRLKLLLTYCDGEEKATAYRAAGWMPQKKNRYISEYLVDGRWLSARDANRKRVTKRAAQTKTVTRIKYVLPLDASVAQSVCQASSLEMAVQLRPGRSKSHVIPGELVSDEGVGDLEKSQDSAISDRLDERDGLADEPAKRPLDERP